MDETPRAPMKAWRFIRSHFVRIVIGGVLVAAAYFFVSVYATYLRELRIEEKIYSHRGEVVSEYLGPDWIPQSIQDRSAFLTRVFDVHLVEPAVSAELLSELGSLTNLQYLDLSSTHITDSSLKHLKGLTHLLSLELRDTGITDAGLVQLKGLNSLEYLDLSDSQVADAGLEHLKGLTNLNTLILDRTQVTAEGRAMLRKALPICKIEPNP